MDQKIKNLIDTGMQRNICVYDADACSGEITDRLISIAKSLFVCNDFNGNKYEPAKLYLGYGAVGQLENRILYCQEKMMNELLEQSYITKGIYNDFFADSERRFEEIKGKLVSYYGLELVVVDGFDEMDSYPIWNNYLNECNFDFGGHDVSLIMLTDSNDEVPLLGTY